MSSRIRHTLSDVAALAGVSRSTVDRVINGRETVHPATRDRVEAALASLNYKVRFRDVAHRAMPQSIAVLLSEGSNPFFAELWRGLRSAAETLPPSVAVRFSGFDPYSPDTLVRSLAALPPEVDCVITVGVDDQHVTRQIDSLVLRGVRVVTLVSDVPSSRRAAFVGQDNFAAGRTAGRLMLHMVGHRPGRLAVLVGHLRFRHLLDRKSGFEQFVGLNSEAHRVVFNEPYGTDPAQVLRALEPLLAGSEPLVGLYLCGGGQPGLFEAMRAMQCDVRIIAHEIHDFTRAALFDERIDIVLAHDLDMLAERVFAAASPSVAPPDPIPIAIHVKESL